jgi:BirA family biotin operon repressor/biotin-[acetyl-CoA-carboxylase] ligase
LVLAGAPEISRNQLAGMLIDALIGACGQYANNGLAPFLVRWDVFDGLCGQRVNILQGSETIAGVYRGVSESGAVVLEGPQGLSEHLAGEVSLRWADRQ